MRTLIALWLAPLGLFWGWYFLSLNDINFGYLMLTRQLHDMVFQLYGNMLGIDPATIPPLIAKSCVFDAFLLLGIWAFRRRRTILSWVRANYARHFSRTPPREAGAGPELPAE